MPGLTRAEAALHSAAAAFAPSDIPGLLCWLDGGLSGKTFASGTLVSQWNDLSGNANHAVFPAGNEADAAGRTINGITALDFNSGAPDYAVMGSSGIGITTSFHIFWVGIIDSNVDNARFVFAGCSSTTDDGYLFRQLLTNRVQVLTCDGVGRNTLESSHNVFTVGTAFVAEAWGDGTTQVGCGTNGTTFSETPSNGCSGPDATALMAGNTGVAPSDGAVGALYIFDHKLTTTERTNQLDYINARFGT